MSFDPLTLLGLIGLAAFTATAYLNYRIYQRMLNEKELTIEYIFLRDPIRTALKSLIVANLIFIISSGITILGFYMKNILISQAFRVGSAALFGAYMTFFLSIYIWTRPEGLKSFFPRHKKNED
jgi:hypothetical protein